jgi:hypothetical protein
VKILALKDLTLAALAEIATLGHEPRQPAFWDRLAQREIGPEERAAIDLIVCELHHFGVSPGLWDERPLGDLTADKQHFLATLRKHIVPYSVQLANEATIWARAIYPLLALAERDDIRAWSLVALAGKLNDVEIRGEVDGALASSFDEEVELPYFVVVEAKRGVGGSDPVPQLLGAMLCAAQRNERDGHPAHEIYGCYTIAAVWTFVRGKLDWSQPKPSLTVLSSREYMERTEAPSILAILKSILTETGA